MRATAPRRPRARRARISEAPRTVELLKAGLGVAKTDATKEKAFAVVVDDAVRVPHFEFQAAVFDARIDFDGVFALVLADAVTNGVFDERLQQQRRHLMIECRGVGVDFDSKAIAETLALNADVEIEEFEFARKRNFVCSHLVKRDAEQLA